MRDIDGATLRAAIDQTFKHGATHPVPASVPVPPEVWASVYARVAESDGLKWRTLVEVTEAVQTFLNPVLIGTTITRAYRMNLQSIRGGSSSSRFHEYSGEAFTMVYRSMRGPPLDSVRASLPGLRGSGARVSFGTDHRMTAADERDKPYSLKRRPTERSGWEGEMARIPGKIVLLLVTYAISVGCWGGTESRLGGDGGSQSPVFSEEPAYRVCQAHLAWDKNCAASKPRPPEEPFWGESECMNGPWRYVQQRVIDAMVACYDSLPCESSDDECTSAGFAAIGIETAAEMEAYLESDPLAPRCGRIVEQCASLSGDSCYLFVLSTQTGRNAAASCLDLECGEIESCLDDPG